MYSFSITLSPFVELSCKERLKNAIEDRVKYLFHICNNHYFHLEPFGIHSEMCSNAPNGDLEIPNQNFRVVIWKFQVQLGTSTHG